MKKRMHRIFVSLTTFFLFFLSASSLWSFEMAAIVGYDRLFRNICLDDFIVELDEPFIPVGCEVIDCCPGCPGPGFIDWRINVEGNLASNVDIKFSNMPKSAFKNLKIKGNGFVQKDGSIRVGQGQTIISGLPTVDKQPVIAIPKFRIQSKEELSKELAKERRLEKQPVAELKFSVEQMIGSYVVNEYIFVGSIRLCYDFEPVPRNDTVDLNNNALADNAVVLLDGRRTNGCVNDEVWRGTNIINVANVLQKNTCTAETIVFSDDDAMQLRENVNIWTNAAGDKQIVDQTPDLLQMPVTVWVMQGTFANTQTRVTNDLARAVQMYNDMNCGITFQTAAINDEVNNANTAGLINANCSQANNLRNNIGFTNNNLNVYYLNNPGARGWWCGNNTIIIGAGADNESLAHEFGHAFTLQHTNNLDTNGDGTNDFANTNLMVTGGTGRTTITEGQCFRSNVNPTSYVNDSGIRTAPTRTCNSTTISSACPDMALDAVPN